MKRRNFIHKATVATVLGGIETIINGNNIAYYSELSNSPRFKLKYAPNFGAFPELAGKDPIDVIRFCSDQGFRAMFDNGLMEKSIEIQDKIVTEITRLNMELGPVTIFVQWDVESLVLKNPEIRGMIINRINKGVEFCRRTGVKWGLIVPGNYNQRMAWDYQTANVIDILHEVSDIAEKYGITIVMEPLNKRDHPGCFLTGIPQAYAICRAVNSPACKICNDIYHQQITEGNLIPNIDAAWSEIAAFHIGDNPGRMEPGTGEINYYNIFKHIHGKGYEGVLCMEHRKSIEGKEGELALIEAYRKADNF